MKLGAITKLGKLGVGIDERDNISPQPHEYSVFDGYFASTPISEYIGMVDGGLANRSSYDRTIDCGSANNR